MRTAATTATAWREARACDRSACVVKDARGQKKMASHWGMAAGFEAGWSSRPL